ncbi:MAG TPA: AlkA N-terminal domain-containing protein [Solirubrobacteraceae bacterium]
MSAKARPVRVEVRPVWPFRIPRLVGRDGLNRMRGGVLTRLLHFGELPVVVRVGQPARDRVLFEARADAAEAAEWAIQRIRWALGVDQDLRAFHERFRFDPLIGAAVRADPAVRVMCRPEPFEALTWAVCEQLIDYERASDIERRLTWALGRRCPRTGLRDAPTAEAIAAATPPRLESLGLSASRSVALIKAAREVARGRVDLFATDHEHGWRRLRAIPGIGSWTVQMLALTGQGRLDQIPAGDLKFLKLVGQLKTGHPRARATEEEVAELFAPYAPWAGLAGAYALRSSKFAVTRGASASAA